MLREHKGEARPNAAGDRLPFGADVFPGHKANDTVLWVESQRAVVSGDTLVDFGRGLEINEAFSSVALNSTRMLGADEDIVNVNGGAVALGHPIGASGGRIVGTMVHELRRNGGGLGLAAICSGGGQGDALLLEV